MDLVALTARRGACAPKTACSARVSATSPCFVEVPCAFTCWTALGSIPAAARAARIARCAPLPPGGGCGMWWATALAPEPGTPAFTAAPPRPGAIGDGPGGRVPDRGGDEVGRAFRGPAGGGGVVVLLDAGEPADADADHDPDPIGDLLAHLEPRIAHRLGRRRDGVEDEEVHAVPLAPVHPVLGAKAAHLARDPAREALPVEAVDRSD